MPWAGRDKQNIGPRARIALVATLTALVLIAGVGLDFAGRVKAERKRLVERGERQAQGVGAATAGALQTAEALSATAASLIEKATSLVSGYGQYLGPVPEKRGYGLAGLKPPGEPEASLNLTGLGRLEDDAALHRELEVALSLEPMFRWVRHVYPEAPWVYYLSARRFMCVYPYLPFDDFFMKDAFHDMDLYAGGTPERNPQRTPYVTEVYLDKADRGLMVTFAAPVYEQDSFRGIVGFDLTLESLSRFLEENHHPGDWHYVVDGGGGVIALAGDAAPARSLSGQQSLEELRPGLFELAAAPRERGGTRGFANAQVSVAQVAGVPWMLITGRSNRHIYRTAALGALPDVGFLVILLTGILVFVRERRHQEQFEAEGVTRRFRHLLDSSSDMIAVVDPATARYLDVNETACIFWGVSREQMLARRVIDFSAVVDSMQAWQQKVAELRHKGRFTIEDSGRRPDGSPFWVEVNAHYASDSQGEYIVGVVRDIAERKHAEAERERLQRELWQSQKMEALGELTGGIAHDFNNILAGMLGLAELARDRFGGDNAALADYLAQILEAGERARRLIRQLLIYSRGDSTATAKPMRLVPQIEELLKLLKASLPSTIEIRSDWPDASPVVCVAALHLQQVLMNLVINARDAMPEGGTLTIGVSTEPLAGEECRICHEQIRGEWARVQVADSGTGIASGMLDSMFQPFFTTKQVGEGGGMGLALVQGIVGAYGGHVLVHTAPGQGSCFEILLPLSDLPAQESDPGGDAARGLELGGRRFLVVEDEPLVRRYLSELLELAHAEVVSCRRGDEALDAFRRAPGSFSMVITDQTMPGMTGVQMVRKIRAIDAEVPILMFSGYAGVLTLEERVELGIADVLLKPVMAEELERAIGRVLASAGRLAGDR